MYKYHDYIQHDDVLLLEDATFNRKDRKLLLTSIEEMSTKAETDNSDNVFSKRCMLHIGNGYFNEQNVTTLPGDQVVDMTNLDFSKSHDRAYSEARLAVTPRLMVM